MASQRMQKVTVQTSLDGGYGWVITFSAFMTGVILDGLSFSFGLFYDEFLEYFQESKSKTAWIGSVYNGMYMSIGPIVSFVCNRYGCRVTSIVGGLLASVACLMAVFANCVSVLIVTYGFLGGFGFGMMYLPAIVMVGHYFDRRRAMATGIAVCGSGVGGFVFAYFTKFLISTYTWRGATLILSGVALNGVVFGALLRPLEASVAIEDSETPDEEKKVEGPDTGGQGPQSDFYLSLPDWRRTPAIRADDLNKSQPMLTNSTSRKVVQIDISRPKYRQDAFLIGSCASIVQRCSNSETGGNFASMTDVAAVRQEILRLQSPPSKWQLRDKLQPLLNDALSYWRLVARNPALGMYGIACFLCMAGFFIPFTYIPVYAKTLSLHASAPQDLISVIGWINLISRLMIGWIGDRPWADCLLINSAFLVIGGTATGFFVFYRSFPLLVFACTVFGASIAVFVALRSIIGVELVGVKNLSQAFGVITMCQGLSSFIGTPAAGFIADITGSTVSTFYFAGAAILLSGLICAPLRKIAAQKSENDSGE